MRSRRSSSGSSRIGPRSGYEIKAVVDRSTRFFWAASYSQIDPELRRLEREGLVEGEDALERRAARAGSTTSPPPAASELEAWLGEHG